MGRYQRFDTPLRKPKFSGPTRAAINRSTTPGWLVLHTPYNKTFVEQLKARIQPSHRRWDPTALCWNVNEMFLDVVVELTKKFYDEVTTDLLQEATIAEPVNLFMPVFSALKTLPNGNMDKIYRSLAGALHPDVGGTNELMTKLNQAYEEAKQ